MDGIDWAASAMVAARTRLEIATENLANVSTDGYARVEARGSLTPFGVEVARRHSNAHGALRATGRDFDLAILGDGTFRVHDAVGRLRTTRAGAFERSPDGTLRDAAGDVLQGTRGALHVGAGERIDERGRVRDAAGVTDAIPLPPDSRLRTGFVEGAGVDAISQMVDVLSASRSFESAQKSALAIDAARQKSAEAARIK